jgi:hypothetical protein
MATRTAIAEKITGIARTTAAAEIGGCHKTPRPTEIRPIARPAAAWPVSR